MAEQYWAIYATADGNLLQVMATANGAHPRLEGWVWDPATQRATKLSGPPDQSSQIWSAAALAFVDDIDTLRARRWRACQARRDQVEWAGCATPLGRVDTDKDSQRKISGGMQMAQFALQSGAPFSVDWTMQDNTSVAHDGAAMIAMAIAVGMHVTACHEASLPKRAAIEAATTAAAIAAVDIDTGWPGA